MNVLIVLYSLLAVFSLGWIILKLFNFFTEKEGLERIFYSFGLGMGLISFQMYLYSRISMEWSAVSIFLPWTPLIFVVLLKEKFLINLGKLSLSRILAFLLVGIANWSLIVYVFVESILRPLNAWDGYASWLFRAKMFFIEGSVSYDISQYIPTDYPPLVSLMGTFLYTLLGQIDDRAILLIYAVFYANLAGLFYLSLRKKSGVIFSLLFTFLLLSTQNLIRHSGRFEAGQADVILGFYLFSSLLLFVRYLRIKNAKNLILLQFFLVTAALIKNDGIPLILLSEILILIIVIKNKKFGQLFALLVFAIPFIDWQVFKHSLNVVSAPEYLGPQIHPYRLPIIAREFGQEFLNIKNWNLVWVAFFMGAFTLRFKKSLYELWIAYGAVACHLFILAGVFLITTPNPNEHIPNVLNRALLHVLPIAVYAVSMSLILLKLKLKNEK